MNAQVPVSDHGSRKTEQASTRLPNCCSSCGAEYSGTHLYCCRCGGPIKFNQAPVVESKTQPENEAPPQTSGLTNKQSLPSESPESPPQPKASPSIKPRCACGTILTDGAKFCHECGIREGECKPTFRLVRLGMGDHLAIDLHEDAEATIGKEEECDLNLRDDDCASRRHACVYESNGLIYLRDLSSSNGTFLRIRRDIPLEVGDEFVIGKSLFRLEEASACPNGA